MQHPGDRPDRPPVWVRGGPPYYYQPQHPHKQDVAPEGLTAGARRASEASTTSISSSASSTESPLGSVSFPATPSAPTAQQEHIRASASPSQFPLGQPISQPVSAMPFGSARPGIGPFSAGGGGMGQGPRERRASAGSGSYRNLTTQKWESADEEMRKRRESWREMLPGTDPGGQMFYRRWWDGYTKNTGRRQENE